MTAPALSAPAAGPVVKVLIVGGHGAGKTALVRTLSQIPPVCTDVPLTEAGGGFPGKIMTTAVLDFGRMAIAGATVLLFAAPGHPRFGRMLAPLAGGVAGVVVLVDVTRLADALLVLDAVQGLGLPYLVAANRFPPGAVPAVAEVRGVLRLADGVPVLACDVRAPRSARMVLRRLVAGVLTGRLAPPTRTRLVPGWHDGPGPVPFPFTSSAGFGGDLATAYGGLL